MWSKTAQHVIGATESGKPINFHYSDDGYSPQDHHEAATLHDRKRNINAVQASNYKRLGYEGAANGCAKRAAHHSQQSQKHFEKILPAKNKQPVASPGNSTKANTSTPRPVVPKKPLGKADEPKAPSKIVGITRHDDKRQTVYFKNHEDAVAHSNYYNGDPSTTASTPHKAKLRDKTTGELYDGYGVHMRHWSVD